MQSSKASFFKGISITITAGLAYVIFSPAFNLVRRLPCLTPGAVSTHDYSASEPTTQQCCDRDTGLRVPTVCSLRSSVLARPARVVLEHVAVLLQAVNDQWHKLPEGVPHLVVYTGQWPPCMASDCAAGVQSCRCMAGAPGRCGIISCSEAVHDECHKGAVCYFYAAFFYFSTSFFVFAFVLNLIWLYKPPVRQRHNLTVLRAVSSHALCTCHVFAAAESVSESVCVLR